MSSCDFNIIDEFLLVQKRNSLLADEPINTALSHRTDKLTYSLTNIALKTVLYIQIILHTLGQ